MSARSVGLFCVLLLSAGCKKPPVEAPAELGELGRFLFANFDNEEPDELIAGIPALEKYMDEHDLTGKLDDRTYAMPPLTKDDWGTIKGPAGKNPEDQLPVAVFGLSKHKLQPNLKLTGETNHVCIESNTTVFYRRTFDTDKDCFLNGDCEFLRTSNEVRKENSLAKVWYDMYKDYRVVIDDEDREVLFARGWTEESFAADKGNNSWDQLYTLEVWVPDGGKTKRFYAYWSEIHIAGLGDDFVQSSVKTGIEEGYFNADQFISDRSFDCGNDRDRPYDRN